MKVGDLSVNCLLYADVAMLIASSECELHPLVTTLKEGYENNGLSPSVSKKEEIRSQLNGSNPQ